MEKQWALSLYHRSMASRVHDCRLGIPAGLISDSRHDWYTVSCGVKKDVYIAKAMKTCGFIPYRLHSPHTR